jgi:hypothetical protein
MPSRIRDMTSFRRNEDRVPGFKFGRAQRHRPYRAISFTLLSLHDSTGQSQQQIRLEIPRTSQTMMLFQAFEPETCSCERHLINFVALWLCVKNYLYLDFKKNEYIQSWKNEVFLKPANNDWPRIANLCRAPCPAQMLNQSEKREDIDCRMRQEQPAKVVWQI